MTKDVLVTISGLHFDVDSDDTIEVVTAGKYYFRNSKHYIIYDEYADDDSSCVTKNTLKISDKHVEMLKQGSSNVHMIFEEGKDNTTYYDTPFGSLQIGTSTSKIILDFEEDEIQIKIHYDLSVNYSHVSTCCITLKISSTSKCSSCDCSSSLDSVQ